MKYNDANNLYEQLLYAQTTKSNTYAAFKEYLDKYPTGPYAKEAKVQYDRKLYEAYLNKNTISGYEEFEQKYPKSPFLGEVQDKLYELSTKDHLASDYDIFIRIVSRQ
jgi:outer membrane protein assembly factor BamD (BamD/ComL family)